ncbi:MAG TPA: invasion associated locus B family protein [Rhizomicrobium sp.]|nr:invasion associated locus B family protein [Rhizomicrobium sp.]
MRDTIIGVVLAVIFVAAIWGASTLHPHVSGPMSAQEAAAVKPGFEGTRMIGPWQLACAPGPRTNPAEKAAIPFQLNPNPHGGAAAVEAAQKEGLGRCRTSLIYRRKDNPKAVVIVVSFRHTDNGRKLALIVRFPALAKQGDTVVLSLGKKGGLNLPVSQCGKGGCMAAGVLPPKGEVLILSTPEGALIFPAQNDGKPLHVLVPFAGLKDALDAMSRAES